MYVSNLNEVFCISSPEDKYWVGMGLLKWDLIWLNMAKSVLICLPQDQQHRQQFTFNAVLGQISVISRTTYSTSPLLLVNGRSFPLSEDVLLEKPIQKACSRESDRAESAQCCGWTGRLEPELIHILSRDAHFTISNYFNFSLGYVYVRKLLGYV